MKTKELELYIKSTKKLNPDLKKIHKYQSNSIFFNNKFDVYSSDPTVTSSYLFDNFDDACELNKALGKGAFGVVKQGVIVKTGKKVAIKIQNINSQIEYHYKTIGDLEQARAYVLKQIDVEDTLLKLTGQLTSSTRRTNRKNQEKHYSIMEYIDGASLKNIFSTLSLEKKIQCFIEITQQMIFLHDNDYVHLDIWRENILFNGHAILHDYGCAAKLIDGNYRCKLKGTHIPPEIIKSHHKREACTYSKYSDVYALGMTFYELFYEDYFDYSLVKTLEEYIKRYNEYYMEAIETLNSKNDSLAQLINKMIAPDFNERLSNKEVLSCLWNDVSFLSPINPHYIYEEYKKLNLPTDNFVAISTYFKIPVSQLNPNETVIWSFPGYSDDPEEAKKFLSTDTFRSFQPESYKELDELPNATKEFYKNEAENNPTGHPRFTFFRIPHVMTKSLINIKDAEVINWEMEPKQYSVN